MNRRRRISPLDDTRGVSAIEFAISFPFLLLLLLGGVDLIRYVSVVKKVELVASSISEMISQTDPTSQGSAYGTVNKLDLHFAYDATLTIFPEIMKDASRQNMQWWQDITIDFASILFTQISNSCNGKQDLSTCYTAKVLWTSTGTVGNNARACNVPQLPTTSMVPNKLTLPSNVFGPGTIIAIDVVYTFTPLFGSQFLSPLKIARSVYVQPRYVTEIDYNTAGNDGIAQNC